MTTTIGRVLGIAIRDGVRGVMVEQTEARATENGGVEGDNASRPDRGLTLLASQQWKTVQQELQAEIPWYSRRANVLVEAESLGGLIGRVIDVGPLRVEVLGETKPCDLMDRVHPGLKSVLMPDYRAGVHARILRGGVLRVGDRVALADSA